MVRHNKLSLNYLYIILFIIPCYVYQLFACPDCMSSTNNNYSYSLQWDSHSNDSSKFNSPTGIAVDSSRNIYVSDTWNNRIQKFNNQGSYLLQWGGMGIGNGQFWLPGSIAVDKNENVYIADVGNNRIQKFNSQGNYIGQWGTYGSSDGQFDYISGIHLDKVNNVYVSDSNNNCIQKFDTNGNFLFKWGGYGSEDGQFDSVHGITVDNDGNLFVADSGNDRIMKFDSNGNFVMKWGGYGSTDGQFNKIRGIAADTLNYIYVIESGNDRIQKFDNNGVFIGSFGSFGSSDGLLFSPYAFALNSNRNIYVADTGNDRIQVFTPALTMTTTTIEDAQQNVPFSFTFAGTGGTSPLNWSTVGGVLPSGVTLNTSTGLLSGTPTVCGTYPFTLQLADSGTTQSTTQSLFSLKVICLYGACGSASGGNFVNAPVINLCSSGTASSVTGTGPWNWLCAGSIAGTTAACNAGLLGNTIDFITTVAGNGNPGFSGDGGAATSASLQYPNKVAVDNGGDIYIADTNNHRIRKVTISSGIISTVAGNGTNGFSGDGGTATLASLYHPTGVSVDSAGNIYIADTGNARIRKVIISTGIITTIAGNGGSYYSGDGGAATSAGINYPTGITVDNAENLYIAETNNHRIRKVTLGNGIIATVAGNGTNGFSGDDGAATSASLNGPSGVTVDSAGNIYIADTNNFRIRKVPISSGIITTVAGNGNPGFSGDDGAATSARLQYPYGVSVDSAGNLYVADSSNNRVRKITASSGIITTVAGNGTAAYSGDGSAATLTTLKLPLGVAIDSAGNLYIADAGNERIRKVTIPAVTAPAATTGFPSAITATGSTLNGSVNDMGTNTTVTFEYGQTNGYGSRVPGGTVTAGSGNVSVSATVTGLVCNTTYHFRIVGLNSGGTANGTDQTFTTIGCGAIVNGNCGISNGSTFTAAPVMNLCTTGAASLVTGVGPWDWSCVGSNGGTTATCNAGIQTYAVTFQSGGNGTLTGATSQVVKYGAAATAITAVPATGYNFVNWTGTSGFATTTTNPLTISNVTSAQIINANFAVTPDFIISTALPTLSVAQGASIATNVTTSISGGFSNAVAFSATGLPAGATAIFSPTSIAAPGSGSATLTLTAGTATPTGPYSVTVTGTGGGKTHTATVSFTVTGTIATGTPRIAAGTYQTMALKTDGTVWSWGWNNHGQLGDGTIGTDRFTPVQVSELIDVSAISAGSQHTVALKTDGTVWAWGYNGSGQLGDGTTGTDRLTPVQVSGLDNVSTIAAGYYHTVALKTDGTVWAWGYNGFSQLGDETNTDRLTPVQVSGLVNVSAIAAGDHHTVVLKTDGTVWAWGYNGYGQLGDGTSGTNRPTTVQVSGLADVSAITAGRYHTVVLKTDGTVWAWGNNANGQLGDGTTGTDRLTPVQVTGLANVSAITAGTDHTVALKTDGTVWAWGYNGFGQLGDGTNTDRHTPVQVSGLTNVSAIAAGAIHTVALKTDGTVWAWGYNGLGQLGVETTNTQSLTPVQARGLVNVITTQVSGVCGSSNNGTFTTAPSNNLCSTGTASAVIGTGPWNWSCTGSNGGSTANCTASIMTIPINFQSGGNGTLTGSTSQTVNYDANTTAVSAIPGRGYHFVNWTAGVNEVGTSATLIINNVVAMQTITANFAPDPLNGACGLANTATVTTIPTTNLCGDSSLPTVTGTGPWNWNCSGQYGGSTAPCSANKARPGDCDNNGSVTIAEVALAYNMFLGIRFLEGCVDLDANNIVSMSEVQKVINGFLDIPIGSIDSLGPSAQIALGSVTGIAGGQVTIPITLTTNGASLASLSVDIGYDPSKISFPVYSGGTGPPTATRGPAILVTDENGDPIKNIVQSTPSPGVLRMGISAATNVIAISDGIVAYIKINIAELATGELFLTNISGAAAPDATNVPVTAVNGIITANVVLFPVDGTCGISNGQTFATAPTSSLCSYTSITPTVTSTGSWNWTCSGSNGGSTAQCTANKSTVITKPGDSDGDGSVSIAEVQSSINMFLGVKGPELCVDQDGVGGVTISEVQKVINGFLGL